MELVQCNPNATRPKGWAQPKNCSRSHYFVNGRSLCKQWEYDGKLYPASNGQAEACVVCKRRLSR